MNGERAAERLHLLAQVSVGARITDLVLQEWVANIAWCRADLFFEDRRINTHGFQ